MATRWRIERASGRAGRRYRPRIWVALLAAAALGASAGTALAQGSAATDRAALEALYSATDGANWTTNTNWLSSAPLGEWAGVLTDSNGRVTYLDLDTAEGDPIGGGSGNNLRGSIPSDLGQLTELTDLSLGYNDLAGPLPPELGNLRKLTVLHLEESRLTGPIPRELGNLTNLTWLALGNNELTGPIPVELANLTHIETLALFGNRLTGEIPVELGRLTGVEWLQVGGNQLTGTIPIELGHLTGVTLLSLGPNRLTGPVPAQLGNLTSMVYLYLGENRLSGPIAADLGRLDSLMALTIDGDTGLCLASDFPLASAFAGLAMQSSVELCATTPEVVPDAPEDLQATSDGAMVTLSWNDPQDSSITHYEYGLQREDEAPGRWKRVADSDADTTSITIDLTTGEAQAGSANAVAPAQATVEWTIWLRAVNSGGPGTASRTVVSAMAVPAVPAVWLGVGAVLLVLARRRAGRNRRR